MAINDVSASRRRSDLEKLRQLQARMPRFLSIVSVVGDPVRSMSLRIIIPTAKNDAYPTVQQQFSEVEIALRENYPFPPGPLVTFKTPIWNPNVFQNGQWCFGEWKVTENLELFVTRLMKVIALDPTIINPKSPANGEAARWFDAQRRLHPNLFPTVTVTDLLTQETPKIKWNTVK